ncbi:DNA binding transcription coactivator transcription factor [Borealophlyctis nickersoniae]|nr:DNA binding transcription coactivator transcription factor [Borealophlyctis nickersoniae]
MANRTCRLLIYARRSVAVWRTPPSRHLSVAASATDASTSALAETEAAVPTVPTQPACTPPSSQFAKSSVVGRNLSDIDTIFAPADVVWTAADTELLRSSVTRYGRRWHKISEEVFNSRVSGTYLNVKWAVLEGQRVKGHWSALEDAQLLEALIRAQHIKWVKLVNEDPTLPSRGPKQMGYRWNKTLKPAMMGRLWTVIKSTAKDSAERKNALAAMRGTWNPVKIKVLKDLAQARRELAEKAEAVPRNRVPFTEEEDEELWKLCSGCLVADEAGFQKRQIFIRRRRDDCEGNE